MPGVNENTRDGVVGRFAALIEEWRRWRAERDELAALGEEPARRVLSDCGLTFDDLDRVLNPKSIELLPEMMKLVGAPDDATTLACRHDLERTCGACEQWRRCEAALLVGTAADTWREFCANAETLDALIASREEKDTPK